MEINSSSILFSLFSKIKNNPVKLFVDFPINFLATCSFLENDLNDFMHIGFDPNLRDEVRAEIEAAHTKTEKRLEKLTSMRDDVEELLNKILKAEVAE